MRSCISANTQVALYSVLDGYKVTTAAINLASLLASGMYKVTSPLGDGWADCETTIEVWVDCGDYDEDGYWVDCGYYQEQQVWQNLVRIGDIALYNIINGSKMFVAPDAVGNYPGWVTGDTLVTVYSKADGSIMAVPASQLLAKIANGIWTVTPVVDLYNPSNGSKVYVEQDKVGNYPNLVSGSTLITVYSTDDGHSSTVQAKDLAASIAGGLWRITQPTPQELSDCTVPVNVWVEEGSYMTEQIWIPEWYYDEDGNRIDTGYYIDCEEVWVDTSHWETQQVWQDFNGFELYNPADGGKVIVKRSLFSNYPGWVRRDTPVTIYDKLYGHSSTVLAKNLSSALASGTYRLTSPATEKWADCMAPVEVWVDDGYWDNIPYWVDCGYYDDDDNWVDCGYYEDDWVWVDTSHYDYEDVWQYKVRINEVEICNPVNGSKLIIPKDQTDNYQGWTVDVYFTSDGTSKTISVSEFSAMIESGILETGIWSTSKPRTESEVIYIYSLANGIRQSVWSNMLANYQGWIPEGTYVKLYANSPDKVDVIVSANQMYDVMSWYGHRATPTDTVPEGSKLIYNPVDGSKIIVSENMLSNYPGWVSWDKIVKVYSTYNGQSMTVTASALAEVLNWGYSTTPIAVLYNHVTGSKIEFEGLDAHERSHEYLESNQDWSTEPFYPVTIYNVNTGASMTVLDWEVQQYVSTGDWTTTAPANPDPETNQVVLYNHIDGSIGTFIDYYAQEILQSGGGWSIQPFYDVTLCNVNIGANITIKDWQLQQYLETGEWVIISIPHVASAAWPTGSRQITQMFSEVDNEYTSAHRGLDIQGNLNDHIFSMFTGKVYNIGYDEDYGCFVDVDSFVYGKNIRTRYAHLNSISVSIGQSINAGSIIGYMGSTGNSSGEHLHVEVYDTDTSTFIDPLLYLPIYNCPSDDYLSYPFAVGKEEPENEADENYKENKGLNPGEVYLRTYVRNRAFWRAGWITREADNGNKITGLNGAVVLSWEGGMSRTKVNLNYRTIYFGEDYGNVVYRDNRSIVNKDVFNALLYEPMDGYNKDTGEYILNFNYAMARYNLMLLKERMPNYTPNTLTVTTSKEIDSVFNATLADFAEAYNLKGKYTYPEELFPFLQRAIDDPSWRGEDIGTGGETEVNGGASSMTWPVPGTSMANVSSTFGYRIHPIYHEYRFHEGIDISAAEGMPIVAAYDGLVIDKWFDMGGAGHYITIQHEFKGKTYTTTYMHMMEKSTLEIGQTVSQGQVIGYVGSTGASTGPHLHLQMTENGELTDPLSFENGKYYFWD